MDIYFDVRAYVADVFGGNPEDVSLDWNAVGACIHYFDNRRNIQFRLWERSEGHLGIPDPMTPPPPKHPPRTERETPPLK